MVVFKLYIIQGFKVVWTCDTLPVHWTLARTRQHRRARLMHQEFCIRHKGFSTICVRRYTTVRSVSPILWGPCTD
jgi:hypothetical protein